MAEWFPADRVADGLRPVPRALRRARRAGDARCSRARSRPSTAVRRAGGRSDRGHREVRAERAPVSGARRPGGRRRRGLASRPGEGRSARRARRSGLRGRHAARHGCGPRAAGAVAVGVTTGSARPRQLLDGAGADVVLSSLRQFPSGSRRGFRSGSTAAATAAAALRFTRRPLSITTIAEQQETDGRGHAKRTRSSLRTDVDSSSDCVGPAAGATVTSLRARQFDADCNANDWCTSASSCWSMAFTSTCCAVSDCTNCWSDSTPVFRFFRSTVPVTV